jgi:hypothetical protein
MWKGSLNIHQQHCHSISPLPHFFNSPQ